MSTHTHTHTPLPEYPDSLPIACFGMQVWSSGYGYSTDSWKPGFDSQLLQIFSAWVWIDLHYHMHKWQHTHTHMTGRESRDSRQCWQMFSRLHKALGLSVHPFPISFLHFNRPRRLMHGKIARSTSSRVRDNNVIIFINLTYFQPPLCQLLSCLVSLVTGSKCHLFVCCVCYCSAVWCADIVNCITLSLYVVALLFCTHCMA